MDSGQGAEKDFFGAWGRMINESPAAWATVHAWPVEALEGVEKDVLLARYSGASSSLCNSTGSCSDQSVGRHEGWVRKHKTRTKITRR